MNMSQELGRAWAKSYTSAAIGLGPGILKLLKLLQPFFSLGG